MQPLTDEMIEDEALFRFRTGPNYNGDRRKFVNGAKWARDRMAQQAQPKMPTPEAVAAAIRRADAVLALSAKETTRHSLPSVPLGGSCPEFKKPLPCWDHPSEEAQQQTQPRCEHGETEEHPYTTEFHGDVWCPGPVAAPQPENEDAP